jgi:hypothetical protein
MNPRRPLAAAVFILIASQCGMPPGPGGGAGGGTGLATLDNELASGTRLKAVRLKGADGALAPAYAIGSTFWDSQLSDYRSPTSAVNATGSILTGDDGPTYCMPAALRAGQYFADSTCSTPLAGGYSTLYAKGVTLGIAPGLPRSAPVHVGLRGFSDGGIAAYELAGPFSGQAWDGVGDTGCTQADMQTQPRLWNLGATIPLSTYVEFTGSIDP